MGSLLNVQQNIVNAVNNIDNDKVSTILGFSLEITDNIYEPLVKLLNALGNNNVVPAQVQLATPNYYILSEYNTVPSQGIVDPNILPFFLGQKGNRLYYKQGPAVNPDNSYITGDSQTGQGLQQLLGVTFSIYAGGILQYIDIKSGLYYDYVIFDGTTYNNLLRADQAEELIRNVPDDKPNPAPNPVITSFGSYFLQTEAEKLGISLPKDWNKFIVKPIYSATELIELRNKITKAPILQEP